MCRRCHAARPTAQQLLEHSWFSQTEAAADGPAAAAGNMSHVVARLEAFAGMSRMKRLALVVLCHTVTDRHIIRLKVRHSGPTLWQRVGCLASCWPAAQLRLIVWAPNLNADLITIEPRIVLCTCMLCQ